jgi:hypothetical protein
LQHDDKVSLLSKIALANRSSSAQNFLSTSATDFEMAFPFCPPLKLFNCSDIISITSFMTSDMINLLSNSEAFGIFPLLGFS